MKLLTVHVLLYLAANAVVVLLWLMLGGEWGGADDPLDAAQGSGFWPFWVAAVWGVGLALHAALTLVARLWRFRRRRRRRDGGPTDDDTGGTPASDDRPRWIAAMFTDIVGSTALASRLGDEGYGDVLTAHRRTVRELLDDHGGTEVGTQGDGFLVSFATPAEAAACAVGLQRRLADERDDPSTTPHVRIGVHAGEVVSRDGDVLGQMVNVAARVADQAGADEIVVTELVADHAPTDVAVEDLGLRELEGLGTPRHLLALRWER